MKEPDLRAAVRSLIDAGRLSVMELWLQYWALGGNAGILELDAFIHNVPLLGGVEVQVLADALKDLTEG
ncbi:hypothetical protein QF038_002320 [Pseudarthrobacter sp. W1I19]|uniref:hypothetical protein n=1 Tax=Pseudarthrobacter sp. W1I19 TaxID=3042288 RepID=UPI0027857B92|nr:hypothetical protein [Pseudarthrobacter sp. W1I19]MDQ0923812.1 hypothetical protein [Pseudarthrobacter sp. W1I19]